MAKLGYVLMRYGLDGFGNEIGGSALCASASYKKIHDQIRRVLEIEQREADEDTRIYDYDKQVVVEYGGNYDDADEQGVRYIIESIEIL